jgi:hypothetical protein
MTCIYSNINTVHTYNIYNFIIYIKYKLSFIFILNNEYSKHN